MLPAHDKYYSIDDYLALEDKAEYKSEYHDGEIVMMAGSTDNHNLIAGNVYMHLRQAFRDRQCRAFVSEMKIQITARNRFVYPDLMAVCGAIDFYAGRRDIMTNPTVIFEVLSKSTQRYDRTDKFDLYKTLSSLQTYVLIDQEGYLVERLRKTPEGFWYSDYYGNLTDVLELPVIDFAISLADIYDEISFDETESEEHPL